MGEWPALWPIRGRVALGSCPPRVSHRSVRGHIRPYGSSSNPFASPRQMPRRTRHSLSVGFTVTPGGSSKPPKVFLANGVVTRCLASHPPGPLRVKFPGFYGTIEVLRLPAVSPTVLRFLRLAVPRSTQILLPPPLRAAASGLGFGHPVSPSGHSSWKRQDLPSSWGTPIPVCTCSPTPAGRCVPDQLRDDRVAPTTGNTKAPTRRHFRGSIAWLSGSLPTYHASVSHLPRKASFQVLGQTLPDGLLPAGLR